MLEISDPWSGLDPFKMMLIKGILKNFALQFLKKKSSHPLVPETDLVLNLKRPNQTEMRYECKILRNRT